VCVISANEKIEPELSHAEGLALQARSRHGCTLVLLFGSQLELIIRPVFPAKKGKPQLGSPFGLRFDEVGVACAELGPQLLDRLGEDKHDDVRQDAQHRIDDPGCDLVLVHGILLVGSGSHYTRCFFCDPTTKN
jgi:hypothetical protein